MKTERSLSKMMGDGPTKMDRLLEKLKQLFPKAKLTLDYPEINTGSSYLDIVYKGHWISVECRHHNNFYISRKGHNVAFGEGAELHCSDISEVIALVRNSLPH